MRRIAAVTLLAATLAGCVAAPKAPPPPPNRPTTVIAAPPPAVLPAPLAQPWDELPVIEGAWELAATGRSARFVDESGLERATFTCAAPGRSIQLGLTGERAIRLEILTSSDTRELVLQGGVAELPVGNALLDAIAFSRGRFALRASQLLVLPVQSEIGRVIEDCRS